MSRHVLTLPGLKPGERWPATCKGGSKRETTRGANGKQHGEQTGNNTNMEIMGDWVGSPGYGIGPFQYIYSITPKLNG
jgi:hypothetical protein